MKFHELTLHRESAVVVGFLFICVNTLPNNMVVSSLLLDFHTLD